MKVKAKVCLIVTGDTTDKVSAMALPVEGGLRLAGLIGLSALASAAGKGLLVTISRSTPATAIVPLGSWCLASGLTRWC